MALRATAGTVTNVSAKASTRSATDIPSSPPALAPTIAAAICRVENVVKMTAARVILPVARHTAR
jgi:hypothetical protein